jgi:hypothetical protein
MAPCWSQPDFVAYAFHISNLREKVGIWGYFFCLHMYIVKVSLDGWDARRIGIKDVAISISFGHGNVFI